MNISNVFDDLSLAVKKICDIGVIYTELIDDFKTKGLESDLTDIFQTQNGELITIVAGDIRKAIVHISDISNYYLFWSLPKYHIFECKTLIDMRLENRGHRYRRASRTDGKFYMVRSQNDGVFEDLKICKNCKEKYKGKYPNENFTLAEYLTKPILQDLMSTIADENDMTTIPINYSNNWQKISEYQKQKVNYTCQKCFKFLGNNLIQYLHTHHINANRGDNRESNLIVLCIKCHAEEFNHGHIRETPEYIEYISL
jgi:hypothetical protein